MKKPKGKKDLRRRRPKREPYDLVLIVTEGEKTEPNYFDGLRDHLELSTANIVVVPDAETDPSNIVDYCVEVQKNAKKSGEPYDRLCCIFDGDVEPRCRAALDKASRTPENICCYITTPCFEYWILLHFEFTRRPFSSTPGGAACSHVIKQLKNHLPKYEKSSTDIFSQVKDRIDEAVANGRRSLDDADVAGERNPSTEVHLLVEYLTELGNRQP